MMKQDLTGDEKFLKMTQEPVEKLVVSLAIPTIVSMLVSSIYNMADTYFVSQISTSASGAVGVSFPLMTMIQAVGFTLSMGSGNYISRLLGKQDREEASKVLATGFFAALFLGAVLAVLGLMFLDPLVYLLGATETIAPHAKDYLKYILIGAPFMTASYVLNGTLRFQGSAFYSMVGISVGGVLNIILDPIFIFALDMGTAGAATATIISQFISFSILLYNSNLGGNLKISIKNVVPRWSMYKQILWGGLPSFYRQALGSLAMILLNQAAGVYGDAAIAAMAITGRVIFFAISVMLGLGQGFQPVCGFNYGAGFYERVRKAFYFTLKISVAVLIVLTIVLFVTAPGIISLFRKDDLEVIRIGTLALRLQSLTLPLTAWIIMVNMLVQTIGKSKEASIIAISRQGFFFIPFILILPRIIGLLGVQVGQPLADVFSFLVALKIGREVLKELKEFEENKKTPDELEE